MSEALSVPTAPADYRESVDRGEDFEKPVNSALFKQGMRRLAAGVSIIATAFEGKRYGLVATAVSSVSADPPTLLVGVSQTASAHQFIVRSRCFSVNVLSAEDRWLAEKFAMPAVRAQRFDFGEWATLQTGAPILATALAGFDCVVAQQTRIASHTVFFGNVIRVRLREGVVDPLLFWDGAYR